MKASHQIQFPIIHKYTDGTLISMEKLIGMLIHLNVRILQSSLNLPYFFLLFFGGGSSVCLLFCPLKTTESVTKNANEVYFSFFKAHFGTFRIHMGHGQYVTNLHLRSTDDDTTSKTQSFDWSSF